jgi:hypothetical protein
MRTLTLVAAMSMAGLLAACGGSSGGSDAPAGNNNGGGNGNTTTGITLTGVVAKGAALAGANVTAKCAGGTVAPVTAGADGRYTLTIANGTLPCVVQATGIGADATLVLHSVATGTGGTVTANITPLTQLLVAQLSGQDPAAYMANTAGTSLTAQLTGTAVTDAQAAVLATLQAAGVDTSAITNVVTGTLVAANGGTSGNGYDLVLDQLAAALATGGSTLTQLTQTVASSSPANPAPATPAETNPLPADLLMRPHASNCTALRSADYRLIKLTRSATTGEAEPYTALESVTVDAADLSVSVGGEPAMGLTPNGTCRYTLADGEMLVAPSGVLVIRHMIGTDDDTVNSADRGAYRLMIGLPVQNLGLADLAGSWSFLGADRSPLATPLSGKFTVAADGSTSGDACWDDAMDTPEASCSVSPAGTSAVTVNANGGFNIGSTNPADPWSDRVFAFRAGNGEKLLVVINANGSVAVGTRQRTLALPTVGNTTSVLTATVDPNFVAGDAIGGNTHTFASVDANTGTVVRNTATTGSTVTHPQTLVYNSVRNGYLRRVGGSVTASDGSTVNVRPFYGLPLAGIGITAVFNPNTLGSGSNARFSLSVHQ